jgi:hypothetical protein
MTTHREGIPMTPEVEQAIAEIKQAFPEHPVDIEAE